MKKLHRSNPFIDLIIIGFIIFVVFQVVSGLSLIIKNPLLIAVGILSVFLTMLIFHYIKLEDKISVEKNSLVGSIIKNNLLKYTAIIICILLATSTFTYASTFFGTPHSGAPIYLESLFLTILAYTLYQKR